MKHILIGVDIGTSGTKSVVVNLQGKILGEALEEYPLLCLQNGWAEQNASDWERAVYGTVSKAVRISRITAAEVAGICVSGLFAGSGVPVDDRMRPLRNAIIWMDRRAEEQYRKTKKIISDEELFSVTGNRNDAYFGFNKILWVKDCEPGIWEKTKLFMSSNAYIVYCLTGQITIDYTAAANIGGIYDLKQNGWSYSLMDKLEIPAGLFPAVPMAPDDIAGYLTKEAAQKLGLTEGIPVCAGCTDCLASIISIGVVRDKIQTAVIGTSINWGILHNGFPTEPKLVTMPNAILPRHMNYTYGGITSAGVLCRWFRDTIAPYTQLNGRIVRTEFAMLEAEAGQVPIGSDGLLVLPYFMGERSPVWDSGARGVFCGLSINHTRGHMYRAILESLAYAIRHIRETSDIFEGGSDYCIATGGACSCGLWMQIIADVTGLRIITTSNQVQAPVGDALIAGVATGVIRSYDEARNWCRYGETYEPDTAAHNRYGMYYRNYKHLYDATADIIHSQNKVKENAENCP